MLEMLHHFNLQQGEDIPIWVLDKSGNYTTRSMYRFLTFGGVVNSRMKKIWSARLPMKIKVFLWLAIEDRIQSGVALKHKSWKGDPNCSLCTSPETADHIIFQCVLARFAWVGVSEALGWNDSPISFSYLFSKQGGAMTMGLKLFCWLL